VHFDKDNSDVLIHGCIFEGNAAMIGTGGAIYFHSHNIMCKIEDGVFRNNFAGENGGALSLVTDNYNVKVNRCNFASNFAKESGY
jgi:hypothetical protein